MPKNSTVRPEERERESYDLSTDEREDDIRLAAYYLWKLRGEKHGEDRDDWYAAEASFHEDYTD